MMKKSINHLEYSKNTELNEVLKRLNEEKDEVDDFLKRLVYKEIELKKAQSKNEENDLVDSLLEQLVDKEIELNEAQSKFEDEECARKKLEYENFNLELKIRKLEDYERARGCVESQHLREQLDEISQALEKEKRRSKHLLESNVRQEYTVYFLKEQHFQKELLTVRYQQEEHAAKKELYHVKKRLNEEKDKVDDLLEELDDKKIELNTTLSRLKEEESAKKKLQMQNSSLNLELMNLREEFTGFQCDFLKAVEEKTELQERLAEVSLSLVEEGEVKASVGRLIWTENQEIKEFESEENLTETLLHDFQELEDEDEVDALRPQSHKKQSHLTKLLSRLEEGKISRNEQLHESTKRDDKLSKQVSLKRQRSRNACERQSTPQYHHSSTMKFTF